MDHIHSYIEFVNESASVKASAVAIIRDGEVLILKRGKDAPWEPGKWNLPGGIVEDGETLEQAAIREAQEECGLTPSGLKHISSHDMDDWSVDFFSATKYVGDIELSDECDEFKWVRKNELDGFEFVPFVKEILTGLL